MLVLSLARLSLKAFAPTPPSPIDAALTGASIMLVGKMLSLQVVVRRPTLARPLPWLIPVGVGSMYVGALLIGLAVFAMVRTATAT